MKPSIQSRLEQLVERFEEVNALLSDASVIANQDKWNKEFLENDKRREMRDLMVQRPDSALAREVSSVT